MPENPLAFPSNGMPMRPRGMTLLDWFAEQALAGLLLVEIQDEELAERLTCDVVAERSYEIARAMLEERERMLRNLDPDFEVKE